MLQGTSNTRVTAPAPPPVDLNYRLDPVTVGMYAAMLVGGALVLALGAWLASLGMADPLRYRTAGGWIWLGLGVVLALAGAMVWILALWHLFSLARYQVRALETWTEQVIWERQQAGGQIVSETATEWTLSASDPRHLLLVAVACYWQATKRGEDAPWSVRKLRRLELTDGSGNTLIGEASEDQARLLAELLARAGVVRGRREKSAGQLAVTNADELLEAVVPMLRRV